MPHVALIVSGGHTQLVCLREFGRYELLGQTRDDAAGEAFDKVAKLLGLGYPGGRPVDERAKRGDENYLDLPQLMKAKDTGLDFSFSGLKTAIRNEVAARPNLTDSDIDGICASFQRCAIEVLVRKTAQAVEQTGVGAVQVCGGVACNSGLRAAMHAAGKERGFSVHIAPPRWCTDNAAMIAATGYRRFMSGQTHPFTLAADPNRSVVDL